jgi:uncharacterized protein (TIGR02466 family)
MSGSRNDWFPTPVWHFQVENYQQLNSVLLAEIEREQQCDRRGEQLSNILGWHSTSNLHQRESFAELVRSIDRNVLEVATFLKWDLQRISIDITTCWAMVNGKYASNALHDHPNSILSGVYYLKTPEKSGVLSFTDPRSASRMLNPPITEYNLWTLPKISYKPEVGMMLLFPSWLMHGVETNMSEETRISVSFNIGMLAKSD